jgi:hypothetical protein
MVTSWCRPGVAAFKITPVRGAGSSGNPTPRAAALDETPHNGRDVYSTRREVRGAERAWQGVRRRADQRGDGAPSTADDSISRIFRTRCIKIRVNSQAFQVVILTASRDQGRNRNRVQRVLRGNGGGFYSYGRDVWVLRSPRAGHRARSEW